MDLQFTKNSYVGSLSDSDLETLKKVELGFQADTKEVEWMEILRNDLETWLYSSRNTCNEGKSFGEYMKKEEKESGLDYLQKVEDWLYDEEDNMTKQMLIDKIGELSTYFSKFESRKEEHSKREAHIRILESSISKNSGVEGVKEIEAWLQEKNDAQKKLGKTDDPILLIADLKAKLDEIEVLTGAK